jgi:hypothetical protein
MIAACADVVKRCPMACSVNPIPDEKTPAKMISGATERICQSSLCSVVSVMTKPRPAHTRNCISDNMTGRPLLMAMRLMKVICNAQKAAQRIVSQSPIAKPAIWPPESR